MAHIQLAPEVAGDIECILEHLALYDVQNSHARLHQIIQAIAVLERNPLIGRPVEGGKRELVIGKRVDI